MADSQPALPVTGAGGNIGAEIAALAPEAGYRVGALDVNADGVQRTADEVPGAVALVGSVDHPALLRALPGDLHPAGLTGRREAQSIGGTP